MSQNIAAAPVGPAPPRTSLWWVWVIVAVAALVVAGCTPAESVPVSETTATTPAAPAEVAKATVPDLTSDPRFVADAILALQRKGFAVALTGRRDEQNRPGFVVDQSPAGKASRPQGSVVQLTIGTRGNVDLTLAEEESKRLSADAAERFRNGFAGDFQVVVPQVDGRRVIDAMLALQQRGLRINVDVLGKHDSLPLLVVASENPGADESVDVGTVVEIKCIGNEIDATPDEIARLSRENAVILKRAREILAQAKREHYKPRPT